MIFDAISLAFKSLAVKKAKTVLTAFAMLIPIACLVGVLGVSKTSQGQIAVNFNKLQATHISVQDFATKNSETNGFSFEDDSSNRVKQLNGAENAAVYYSIQSSSENNRILVNKVPQIDSSQKNSDSFNLIGAEPSLFETANSKLSFGVFFNEFHNSQKTKVAVLGNVVAKKLGIDNLQLNPTVFYNNDSFLVIGVLQNNDVDSELNKSLIIPILTARERYGDPEPINPAKMLIKTQLGAAEQISKESPLVLNPRKPSSFLAIPPANWENLTQPLSDSVNILIQIIFVIVLISGAASIATISFINVNSRKNEIGLIKAIGGSSKYIFTSFVFEGLFLGILGALIGNAIGVLSVILFALVNNLTPIFEISVSLLSPVIGALIGVIASLIPALKACSLNPIDALRS